MVAGAFALVAVLAVLSGAVALITGSAYLSVLWRACSMVDGLVLLIAGLALLTNRNPKKTSMKFWEKSFPGLSFCAALAVVAGVLTLAAGLFNYLAL